MVDSPEPGLTRRDARATILVLVVICLCAVALRLYLGWWLGFLSDLTCFQLWALEPHERLAVAARYPVAPENYPPIYVSVLRLLRWAHAALDLPGNFLEPVAYTQFVAEQRPIILLLKLPSVVADVVSAVVICALGRHLGKAWLGVGLAALYLFSPAILYNGAYFGQTDTILLAFLFTAVFAFLRRRPVLLSAMMAGAFLLKVQAFFVLMILGVAVLGEWRVWRKHLPRLAAGSAAALGIVAALAALTGKLGAFKTGYAGVVGLFPKVSLNALNLWWLLFRPWDKPPHLGDFPKDTDTLLGLVSYRTIGMVLFFIAMGLILWLLHRRRYTPYALVLACAAAGWAFFNLLTEMHERYLVVAVGFMCVLPFWHRRWYLYALLASATGTINMAMVAYFHFPPSRTLTNAVNWFIWPEQHMVWTVVAGLHIVMLALVLEALWRDRSDEGATVAAFPVIAQSREADVQAPADSSRQAGS